MVYTKFGAPPQLLVIIAPVSTVPHFMILECSLSLVEEGSWLVSGSERVRCGRPAEGKEPSLHSVPRASADRCSPLSPRSWLPTS